MTTIPEWLKTDHSREVIEAALAHVVRNRVEAAYARSDLFDRRRVLMDDWARYLAQGRERTGNSESKEAQGIGCPHPVHKRQALIQPAQQQEASIRK